jgi:hypothetical protein
MKAFLCSQDGNYNFPIYSASRITTIGRENCDININVRLDILFISYLIQSKITCL